MSLLGPSTLCALLLSQPVAREEALAPPQSEAAPPAQRATTVSYSIWKTSSYASFFGGPGHEPLHAQRATADVPFVERSSVSPSTGYRQVIDAMYSPSQELDYSLTLTLSSDVVDVITGLAGGVRMGGWLVRAESSSFKGEVTARDKMIVPPEVSEVKSRYATVRAGTSMQGGAQTTARGVGQGVVLGVGLAYHRTPMVGDLRLADGSGEADLSFPLERVLFPNYHSLFVGFWFDFDNLRALMAEDGSDVYAVRLIESDAFDLSAALDVSVLVGPGVRWAPAELDGLVERVTGTPFHKPGPGFGLMLEGDLRLGVLAAFIVAGRRVAATIGFQGLFTGGFTPGSGVGFDGLEPDMVNAGVLTAPQRIMAGPYLRLAAEL